MSAYINGPVVVRLTADTEGEHNHDSCEEHPVHKLVLSPRHAQNKTRKSFYANVTGGWYRYYFSVRCESMLLASRHDACALWIPRLSRHLLHHSLCDESQT